MPETEDLIPSPSDPRHGQGRVSAGEGGRPVGLGDFERAVLDFEGSWQGGAAPREQEVRQRFGVSTPRYLQVLNAILDDPEAMAVDPVLVGRLRRQREVRRRSRSAARLR